MNIHIIGLIIIAALSLYSSAPLAQETSDPNFTVDNLTLVDSQRVSRTDYEYTYTVDLTNSGPDATNTTATVTSTSLHTTIVDGELTFGDVASGTTVTSTDTFTMRQNRRYPFDPGSLELDIDALQSLVLREVDGTNVGPYLIGREGTDSKGNRIIAYLFPMEDGTEKDLKITEGHYYGPYPASVELITEGFIRIEYPFQYQDVYGERVEIRVNSNKPPTGVKLFDNKDGVFRTWPFGSTKDGLIAFTAPIVDGAVIFALIVEN